MASHWVRRRFGERAGWTGPIRSARQAAKEADAWRSVGWDAEVVESTPAVRAEVRAWVKSVGATREALQP
jgi:hypothetical protein